MSREHDVREVGMREAFAATATDLLDEDLSVTLVYAEISGQYLNRAERAHPERVVNVGIREQLLVNVGAGMALTGLRPIVHTIGSFLVERGFEQIKLGFGHQDVGGVLVAIGGSYDVSAGGRTHQAPGDVALIDTLPGWTVHVPGHPDEVEPLLRSAVAGEERVYLRLGEQRNAVPYPTTGRLVRVREGGAATVVAVGPMLDRVLEAVAGLDVGVLYASTVRPFDAAGLSAALARRDVMPDVVIVEPYLAGTSTRLVAEAMVDVPHRVLGLGVPRERELRRYGTPDQHAAAHGLDPVGLRRSISRFLETPRIGAGGSAAAAGGVSGEGVA
ncbi:MAG TPA: transketolase [Nocardioidaceae bacterium]|nr:transketolase [Nocardioidaceae bacterium]